MNTHEAIARLKLSLRPTKDLIRDFILSGILYSKENGLEMSMVRSWMMDELESRNPEAYSAWLDQDYPSDESLHNYFHC